MQRTGQLKGYTLFPSLLVREPFLDNEMDSPR